MALLLKDNKYVKIDLTGKYTIYRNRAARNREKKNITPKEVLQKYQELLGKYDIDSSNFDEEYYYYNPASFHSDLDELLLEERQYKRDLESHYTKNKYPIMAEHIPEVSKTIPEIVDGGYLNVSNLGVNSLEELYNYIKEHEVFGPTDEVKDA